MKISQIIFTKTWIKHNWDKNTDFRYSVNLILRLDDNGKFPENTAYRYLI